MFLNYCNFYSDMFEVDNGIKCIDIYIIKILILYVRCFDSLISRGPSRGPNNFYVYMNHSRILGEVAAAQNRFKHPSNLLLIVPRRCFCCSLF